MDLEDRAADVWEPLIAVADLAGGRWPALARAAATKLTADAADDDTETVGVQLLHDLHEVFASLTSDWVPTEVLQLHLRRLDGAPWSEMDLTGHKIGKLLGEFGIKSVRNPERTKRGYTRVAFTDAWERYPIPDQPGQASEPSRTVRTPAEQRKHPDACPDASDVPDQASRQASARSPRPAPSGRFRTVRTLGPPRTRARTATKTPATPSSSTAAGPATSPTAPPRPNHNPPPDGHHQ
jgi:hypothetical protein